MKRKQFPLTRRHFLAGSVATTMGLVTGYAQQRDARLKNKALIAITLDLEMSRHYPKRGMMEWDFQKGNLDDATKQYTVDAARVAKQHGGMLHTFCVGRVLEQSNVDWLKQLVADGHLVGNHTYDHINVKATTPQQAQFRFQRAPWLVRGRQMDEIVRDNIHVTSVALKERAGISESGFRTPGGFGPGLTDRPDLQKLLRELGFDWVSSQYTSHLRGEPKQEPTPEVYASIVEAQQRSQPYVYPNGLIEIPMSPISDVTAFRSTFWKLEYFLKALRMSLEWAIENRAVFDFLAHPSCLVVEDPKFEIIKLICKMANQAGDRAEIVGLDTIAEQTRLKAANS